jgi:hypothetical protein
MPLLISVQNETLLSLISNCLVGWFLTKLVTAVPEATGTPRFTRGDRQAAPKEQAAQAKMGEKEEQIKDSPEKSKYF